MIPENKAVFEALQKFAENVTKKMTPAFSGEPEDQLRAPFESFMQDAQGKLLTKALYAREKHFFLAD